MKISLVFAVALLSTCLRAQAVEDVVAAACGGGQTSAGVTYQWLLGELMVDLYADGISLDQGFGPDPCFTVSSHQPDPELDIALAVYPNPTTEVLHLESFSLKNYQAILYDLQGHTLLQQQTTDGRAALQLHNFLPGNYFLAIWKEGRLLQSFVIQKLQ